MGKHGKSEDLNNKPYDQNANPEQKAKEFDQQYGQNRNYSANQGGAGTHWANRK